MALIRRERPWPLEPVTVSDEWVERVFRDMFRDFVTGGALFGRVFDGGGSLIRLEEFVDGQTCVIRAELPGIDPDKDVEITVSRGVLHLKAHREEKEKAEESKQAGYRSEFHYGSFERAIRLPEGATEDDVKASYTDGILEVRVPIAKPAPDTTARIPITHT